MAAIVLVHGIDQQQYSADSLEKDWVPALAGGVRTGGFREAADRIWRGAGPDSIETRMAFYGNLFLQRDQQGDDPGEFTVEEEPFAEGLALEWLERAATRAANVEQRATAARELAFLQRKIGREEAGVGAITRRAISSLARVRWFAPVGMAFAERFVKKALAQVTGYLTDDAIRSAALKSVLDLVARDTKVIIGHSLGSVVAYEAVHRITDSLPLLVTIGSPLGLETIIYEKLRPQPPTYPSRVRRWVNIADGDDVIAAEPDLTRMFCAGIPQGAIFEGHHTVDNGAQPHRADFYLTKAGVGTPVGETLSGV